MLLLQCSEAICDWSAGLNTFERAGADEEKKFFRIVNHGSIKCDRACFAKSQSKSMYESMSKMNCTLGLEYSFQSNGSAKLCLVGIKHVVLLDTCNAGFRGLSTAI